MALSIQTFVDPLAFANEIYRITDKPVDSAIAAGFAQWVKGITGELPQIISMKDNKAKIVFTQAQIPIMRKWLDAQVKSALKPAISGPVSYELGPVLNMWAAKYAVPTAAGIFIAGAIATYILIKMRVF